MKIIRKAARKTALGILLAALLLLGAPVTALAAIGGEEDPMIDSLAGARVMLSSWSILNNNISDGFVRLLITLENPSAYYNATNIVVTYKCDAGVYPEYGASNQLYLNRLDAGQSVDREITLRVHDAAVAFSLNFSAEYIDGRSGNRNNQFMVGGSLGENAESVRISGVTALAQADENGGVNISLSVTNTARFDVRGIRLIVRDAAQRELARSEIGDIPSGDTREQDILVTLLENRAQQLMVLAVYTDPNGTEYTTRQEPFNLYQSTEAGAAQQGEPSGLTQPQQIRYIAAAALMLLVLALLVAPRLKQRGRKRGRV